MPALIERPKMTRTMYQALKKHIMKEREKIKQEQEQGALLERIRKETELRKKKEQEASLTLEQTKEQIQQLQSKLEKLKEEKHERFKQLKKHLQAEEDARRQASLREQSEMMSIQPTYSHPIPGVTGHHPMLLQSMTGRPTLYKPPQRHAVTVTMTGQTPVKRSRSPSPPLTIFAGYDNKYPAGSYPATKQPKSNVASSRYEYGSSYGQVQSNPASYANQPELYQQSVGYMAGQSPARKFPQTGHSAFSSYPSHYAHHQKHMPDTLPSQYQMCITQPAFMTSGPLQPKQAAGKSEYVDDGFQAHNRSVPASMLPRQPTPHLGQNMTTAPKQQTGFSSQQGPSSRSPYVSAIPQTRYY